MVDPDQARAGLERHLKGLSDEEFLRETLAEAGGELEPLRTQRDPKDPALELLPHAPRRSMDLDAYLAAALSGLDSGERDRLDHLATIVKEACLAERITPYFPGDHTDPVAHADIDSQRVFRVDRTRVKNSDLLIWLGPEASLGVGQEFDIAHNSLVPMLLLIPSGAKVSRMVLGIPSLKMKLEYIGHDDLQDGLQRALIDLRPKLEARKLAFRDDLDIKLVGEKVRVLRTSRRLTRQGLADATGLDVEAIEHLEQSSDREADPSLTHLRRIAAALGTTVSDLVEPNLADQLIPAIQTWVEERMNPAAREGTDSRDRNKLVRRILLRILDQLEEGEK